MTVLPEPTPTAPAAGQAHNPLTDSVINAAVEHALQQTFHRDDSPVPKIGDAPPVPQPGIPPQSKAAVDYAVRVLSTGVSTALCSGGVALVMAASQVADPVVCGIVFGAPVGLAVPIAALSVLVKRTKQALPDEIHNHYTGTVIQDQRETRTENKGVWVKTDNRSQ